MYVKPTWVGTDRRIIRIEAHGNSLVRVRKVSFGLGFRFKLFEEALPGAPHMVFPKHSAALFVCGCREYDFNHICIVPKRSGLDAWTKSGNYHRKRLDLILNALTKYGWRSEVIFECETEDQDALGERLKRFILNGTGFDKSSPEASHARWDNPDTNPWLR